MTTPEPGPQSSTRRGPFRRLRGAAPWILLFEAPQWIAIAYLGFASYRAAGIDSSRLAEVVRMIPGLLVLAALLVVNAAARLFFLARYLFGIHPERSWFWYMLLVFLAGVSVFVEGVRSILTGEGAPMGDSVSGVLITLGIPTVVLGGLAYLAWEESQRAAAPPPMVGRSGGAAALPPPPRGALVSYGKTNDAGARKRVERRHAGACAELAAAGLQPLELCEERVFPGFLIVHPFAAAAVLLNEVSSVDPLLGLRVFVPIFSTRDHEVVAFVGAAGVRFYSFFGDGVVAQTVSYPLKDVLPKRAAMTRETVKGPIRDVLEVHRRTVAARAPSHGGVCRDRPFERYVDAAYRQSNPVPLLLSAALNWIFLYLVVWGWVLRPLLDRF